MQCCSKYSQKFEPSKCLLTQVLLEFSDCSEPVDRTLKFAWQWTSHIIMGSADSQRDQERFLPRWAVCILRADCRPQGVFGMNSCTVFDHPSD